MIARASKLEVVLTRGVEPHHEWFHHEWFYDINVLLTRRPQKRQNTWNTAHVSESRTIAPNVLRACQRSGTTEATLQVAASCSRGAEVSPFSSIVV